VVILLIVPGLGPYYRCFILPAHLVIVNSIACLVFRNVQLGRFKKEAVYSNASTSSSLFSSEATLDTVEFATNPRNTAASRGLPSQHLGWEMTNQKATDSVNTDLTQSGQSLV